MAKADPKTFDLAAALAGRTYPTDTIPVYFDEEKVYELAKAFRASNADPANTEKAEAVTSLMDELKKGAHYITIRGVDPSHINEIIDALDDEFPLKTDMLGRVEANKDRGYEFQRRLWALYVIEIKDPKGKVIAPPTAEDLHNFRNTAPESAINAVDEAIKTMREGAEAAYKTMVSDLAFLSKP